MKKVKQMLNQNATLEINRGQISGKLASEIGGSGWNRTADQRLMSPLLYLLSYATNHKKYTIIDSNRQSELLGGIHVRQAIQTVSYRYRRHFNQ